MLKLASILTAAGFITAPLTLSTTADAQTGDTKTKHRIQQQTPSVVLPPVGIVSRSQLDQLNQRSWLDPGTTSSQQSPAGPAYMQSQTILNANPSSGWTHGVGFRELPGPFDIPDDRGPPVEFWTPAPLR